MSRIDDFDEVKLSVIDALRKLQRNVGRDVWFTTTEIRLEAGRSHENAQKALYQMASEGWLHVRHREDNIERLYYRLRAEYE